MQIVFVLEEFFHLRLKCYEKRKKILLENLELKLVMLDNKVRFILGVVHGEIIVSNRKRADLFQELQAKGFAPFRKETKTIETAVAGSTDDSEETEENSEATNKGVRASDYEYLLSMAIGRLTLEKVQELCADKDKLVNEVDALRKATPENLWLNDLGALEEQLDEQEKIDAQAEEMRKARSKTNGVGTKVSRQAPKKPRKNNTKADNSEAQAEVTQGSTIVLEAENAADVVKPKRGAGARKAPAPKPSKSVPVSDDDEDFELLDLKERLAAYNLESSSDNSSALEDKVPEIPVQAKEPSRRAASRMKPSVTILETSEEENGNDSGDDDYEIVDSEAEVAKKKGGRKPSAAVKISKPPAATKKGQANKQQAQGMTQRLLTEMLKPAESTGVSPEKKVRKMRASPFNKKSSSVLGREGKADSAEMSSTSSSNDSEEVAPLRGRPQRLNRKQTRYVVSDSESEKPTDDSDFDEEDD